MTNERIAELEALCAAATEGPWDDDPSHDYAVINPLSPWQRIAVCGYSCNKDFIAAARTALPEALAEIRRHSRVVA